MTIIHIDSSITGEASVTRKLTGAIVDQLRAARPDVRVIERDLVNQPLAHVTLDSFADMSVVDEFLAADTIVIGAPMYNFTVSSQLKAWIDRIILPGATFRYTDQGAEALVTDGKRVIVALARGGFYEEGHALEHLKSYLTGVFGFIGIIPEFVHADGVNYGAEQREAAINNGLVEVDMLEFERLAA